MPLVGSPFGVAITPDGAFASVTNAGSNTVSVIETASNTVLATVSVGFFPFGVAITPDGAFAYVTNSFSDNASVIETASNTVVATVSVGSTAVGVAITPSGPVTPVAALAHFLCYEAKSAEEERKFERRDVDLEDQFGATTKTVKKPKFLCTPVVKNAESVVDLQDSEGHLVCYEVKRPEGQDKFEKRDVLVFNQFEEEGRILTVKKPKILCVPSEKAEVFEVEDDEDDDEDDDDDGDDDDDDDGDGEDDEEDDDV